MGKPLVEEYTEDTYLKVLITVRIILSEVMWQREMAGNSQ